MSDKFKSMNDLFMEVYADKIAHIVPHGSTLFSVGDYHKMTLNELKEWADKGIEEAMKVYAIRNTTLAKKLEGV